MKKLILTALIIFLCGNIFSQQTQKNQTQITVKKAWVRPAAKNSNSAIYFIIENKGPKEDILLSVVSEVAELVEVHETYKKGNDLMGMREVNLLHVPAKSTLEFKPGSYHVMLINLLKDLTTGLSVNATLNFKNAGKIPFRAVIGDSQEM